jgi:hypothetical protein
MSVSVDQWRIPVLQLEYDDEPDDAKSEIVKLLPDLLVQRCDVIVAAWPTGAAILKDRYGLAAAAVVVAHRPESQPKGA